MFLTILLVDRAGRDDARCRAKYGRFWDQYCERVPYRICPACTETADPERGTAATPSRRHRAVLGPASSALVLHGHAPTDSRGSRDPPAGVFAVLIRADDVAVFPSAWWRRPLLRHSSNAQEDRAADVLLRAIAQRPGAGRAAASSAAHLGFTRSSRQTASAMFGRVVPWACFVTWLTEHGDGDIAYRSTPSLDDVDDEPRPAVPAPTKWAAAVSRIRLHRRALSLAEGSHAPSAWRPDSRCRRAPAAGESMVRREEQDPWRRRRCRDEHAPVGVLHQRVVDGHVHVVLDKERMVDSRSSCSSRCPSP